MYVFLQYRIVIDNLLERVLIASAQTRSYRHGQRLYPLHFRGHHSTATNPDVVFRPQAHYVHSAPSIFLVTSLTYASNFIQFLCRLWYYFYTPSQVCLAGFQVVTQVGKKGSPRKEVQVSTRTMGNFHLFVGWVSHRNQYIAIDKQHSSSNFSSIQIIIPSFKY